MAYSFFPNDFQNLPNLQDQVFLMRQKQVAQRLLEKADSDKILYTTGGNIAIPDGLNMTPQERKLMAVRVAGTQLNEPDKVLDNPNHHSGTGFRGTSLPSSKTSKHRTLARDSSGQIGLYSTSAVDQQTGKQVTAPAPIRMPDNNEGMGLQVGDPEIPNQIGKMAVQAGDIAGPFRDEDYTRYGQNLVDQEINDTVQREEDAEGGSYAERRARGRNTRTDNEEEWYPRRLSELDDPRMYTEKQPSLIKTINNNLTNKIIKSVSK